MHAKCNSHINRYLFSCINYGGIHYFSLMFKCHGVSDVLRALFWYDLILLLVTEQGCDEYSSNSEVDVSTVFPNMTDFWRNKANSRVYSLELL